MQKLAEANGNAWAEMKVVNTWVEKTKKQSFCYTLLLAPAKPFRAEHREEFPSGQITSCCPMLWQQACHHPLAPSIFLGMMWLLEKLTSLGSDRHPEPCCRPLGKWQFPWQKQSKCYPSKCYCVHAGVRSHGLKSPSDCSKHTSVKQEWIWWKYIIHISDHRQTCALSMCLNVTFPLKYCIIIPKCYL